MDGAIRWGVGQRNNRGTNAETHQEDDNVKRCFACDRKLGHNPYPADTQEDQFVFVGSE